MNFAMYTLWCDKLKPPCVFNLLLLYAEHVRLNSGYVPSVNVRSHTINVFVYYGMVFRCVLTLQTYIHKI